MHARQPKGLNVYRTKNKQHPYTYSSKSKGRTGAAVRLRFVRLNVEHRQMVLSAWWNNGWAKL